MKNRRKKIRCIVKIVKTREKCQLSISYITLGKMLKGLSIATDSFVKDAFEGSKMQKQITKPLKLPKLPQFLEPQENDLEEFKKIWISKSSEGQEEVEEEVEDGTQVVDGPFKEKLQELLGIQESNIREVIENARRYAVGVPGTLMKASQKDIQEKLNEMEYTVERAVHCAFVGNEIDATTMLNEQAMELEQEFRKVVLGFHEILNSEETDTGSETEEVSKNSDKTLFARNACATEKLTRIGNPNGRFTRQRNTTGESFRNGNRTKGLSINGSSNGVCSRNGSSDEDISGNYIETDAENKFKNSEAANEVCCSKRAAEKGPKRKEEEFTDHSGKYKLLDNKNLSGYYIGNIPEGDPEGIKCRTNKLGRTPIEEALRLLSRDENKAMNEALSVLLDTKRKGPLTQIISCRALQENGLKQHPVALNGDKRLVENFSEGVTMWIPDSWYSLICCEDDYYEASVLSHLVKRNGCGKVKIEDFMKPVDEGRDTSLSMMDGMWFKASKSLQDRNDIDRDSHVSAELDFDSLLLYFLLTEHYTAYAVEIYQSRDRCTSRFVICRSSDKDVNPNWVPYKFMQPGGPWYVMKDKKNQTIVNKCASRIRRCNAMKMPVKHELEIFFKLDAKLKRRLCDKVTFVPDSFNESFDGEGIK
ncbi:uncharacterized protein [Palaemon carinicauda]|uniref:uncharacterized protein isoform X2 n=1 Tax=Palaemon carinicauda TaxID=392227 RepID=UPI0035B64B6D